MEREEPPKNCTQAIRAIIYIYNSIYSALQAILVDATFRGILRGSSIVVVVKVLAKVAAFGGSILLARVLGSELLGIYYTAVAVVGVVSILGTLGLGTATLRFTAEYAARQDWPRVFGVLKSSLVIVGGGSLLLAAVVVLSAPWTSNVLFSNGRIIAPLRCMGLSIVPAALLAVIAGHLRGLKNVTQAEIIQFAVAPLFALPLLFVFVDERELMAAAWVYTTTQVVALAVGAVIWRRSVYEKSGWHDKTAAVSAKKLVRVGRPLLWLSGANLVVTYSDIWILSMWFDEAEVGIYGIVLRLISLTNFVMVAANNTVAARFSDLFTNKRMGELSSLFRMTTVLMLVLGLPIVGAFLLWPGQILTMFGHEFMVGSRPLQVLAVGEIVNLGAGSVGILLVMTGHEKEVRNLGIFVAISNLLLNFALIPNLGALGASIATALAVSVKNVAALHLLRKKLSFGLFSKGWL